MSSAIFNRNVGTNPYRSGVLIGNYVEDMFGLDLRKKYSSPTHSNNISETRKRDKNNNMDIEEKNKRIFGFENDNDNDSQEKDNKYNYHVRNNKKNGIYIKNNKYKSMGDIDFFRNENLLY